MPGNDGGTLPAPTLIHRTTDSHRMHQYAHIRPAAPEEASRLAVLATQVWLHTYATGGVSPEIAAYVLAELTPARYAESLQDPSVHVLVAAKDESLLGLAVLRHGEPCPTQSPRSTVELQTLYVQEHFIGKGLGASLLHSAETWARDRAQCPLWLTVNARNERAIDFYRRHGYARTGTAYFELGASRHENHVLVGGGA